MKLCYTAIGLLCSSDQEKITAKFAEVKCHLRLHECKKLPQTCGMFLAVLSSFEADFCSKNENSPSPNEIGVRVEEDREIMLTSRSGCQCTWRPFFFFGDHLVFTEQLPQTNSRLMKIRVKFVYGWIKLQKKAPSPPPLRNPGYATDSYFSKIDFQCNLFNEKLCQFAEHNILFNHRNNTK